MKKIILILISVLSINSYSEIYATITQINSDIAPEIRGNITSIIDSYLDAIKTENYETTLDYTYKNFYFSSDNNYGKIYEEYSKLLNLYDFYIFDEYYSRINPSKVNTTGNIIPEFNSEKFVVNNIKFSGEEIYNVFMKNDFMGVENLFHIILVKENNQWKISWIQLAEFSINGNNAVGLYKLSKEHFLDKKYALSAFYSIAVSKMLRPLNYLQYGNENELLTYIRNTFLIINNEYKFPIKLSGIKILGIDVSITSDEGIIPIVLYQTNIELEKTKLLEEIKINLEGIFDLFKSIEREFEFIIFSAFNQSPDDINRTYEHHNLIFNTKTKSFQ